MKELSLNILDIAENSTKAGATLTEIAIVEDEDMLVLSVKDNGKGMSEQMLRSVSDPFFTTRTTRSVGLGIPLLKLAAEQTGGGIELFSTPDDGCHPDHGTLIRASFCKKHIDFTPLGDVTSSITTLIQGHPDVDFLFTHTKEGREVRLDTRELREVLDGVPLDTYEVIKWIEGYLAEQYVDFIKKI